MPYAVATVYTCPICGIAFSSTHYKRPARCPACRKIHRAERSLINYRKRKAAGRPYGVKRDVSYDGNARNGAPESVYASTCVIHLRREVAQCQCCQNVTDLINGYCAMCRANGANEWQCLNAEVLK